MSVESAKWAAALVDLGFTVTTVAGEGTADHLVPGLDRAGAVPLDVDKLSSSLQGLEVVVVENLCSLPLNRAASDAVASALAGRPTVLHHHDLAWQRPERPWAGWPIPDDPHWVHVAVNTASVRELAERQGIRATRMPNRFAVDGWLPPSAHEGRVVLHPVRAIPRKDVPAAVGLSERLGATYWLTGPAEDGNEPRLRETLAGARCPVRHEGAPTAAVAYASCDVVAFPSTQEGFGNPVIEAALARRPLAVRRYPVLVDDFEPLGFRWFHPFDPLDASSTSTLAQFLEDPNEAMLDHNRAVAVEHFALDALPGELAAVLERVL